MLSVSVNENLEYVITYYLEGVKCTQILVKDKSVAVEEIMQKMSLMMGLAKGKVFTSTIGRG